MAKSEIRYLPQKVRRPNPITITNTAAPGDIVISNDSGEPTEVHSLILTGDTSADKTIEIRLAKTSGGGNAIVLWVGTLLQNAGLAAGNPAIDVIRENRLQGLEEVSPGKYLFMLPDSWSLYIRSTTSSTTALAQAYGKDYAA